MRRESPAMLYIYSVFTMKNEWSRERERERAEKSSTRHWNERSAEQNVSRFPREGKIEEKTHLEDFAATSVNRNKLVRIRLPQPD